MPAHRPQRAICHVTPVNVTQSQPVEPQASDPRSLTTSTSPSLLRNLPVTQTQILCLTSVCPESIEPPANDNDPSRFHQRVPIDSIEPPASDNDPDPLSHQSVPFASIEPPSHTTRQVLTKVPNQHDSFVQSYLSNYPPQHCVICSQLHTRRPYRHMNAHTCSKDMIWTITKQRTGSNPSSNSSTTHPRTGQTPSSNRYYSSLEQVTILPRKVQPSSSNRANIFLKQLIHILPLLYSAPSNA